MKILYISEHNHIVYYGRRILLNTSNLYIYICSSVVYAVYKGGGLWILNTTGTFKKILPIFLTF